MGKNMGKSLENSVFIATFVGDSLRIYILRIEIEKKNNLHITSYGEKYI